MESEGAAAGRTALGAASAADLAAETARATAAEEALNALITISTEADLVAGTAGKLADAALLGGLNKSIDLKANLQPSRAPIPYIGDFHAFGTSQTEGGTSASSPYVTGGFLQAAYRYPNVIATSKGRNMTVQNHGVGGSTMGWPVGGNTYTAANLTHFNVAGRYLVNGWTGVATFMGGYNDVGVGVSTAFIDTMQSAYEACIARALITDYAGLGTTGLTRSGGLFSGAGSFSFSTTGTDNSTTMTGGAGNGVSPFLFQNAANSGLEYNGSRLRVNLAIGQYAQITLTSVKAGAVFYETSTDGGAFTVSVNGVTRVTGNSLSSDAKAYPGVVWLDNLPASAVIRITSTGGNVKYMATGWVTAMNDVRARTIILVSEGNPYNSGYNDLQRLARACENAVGAFPEYAVYYANGLNHVAYPADVWATDLPHFNPDGHQHIALAIAGAYKPAGASSNVVKLPANTVVHNGDSSITGASTGDTTISAQGANVLWLRTGTAGAVALSSNSTGGSYLGIATENQAMVESRGRDVATAEGHISLLAHSGNAAASSGKTNFIVFTGEAYNKSGVILKDGTWVWDTTAGTIVADSSGAKYQFKGSVSISGAVTSALVKASSTGLLQAAVAGTDYANFPLTATATLDFGSIAAAASADLTITVTGAVVGYSVSIGLPASPAAGIVWSAFVSASNTVTIRATNITLIAVDPASATYRATVFIP
jgi:hypothetical protein